MLGLILAAAMTQPAADSRPLLDPMRPVSEITRTGFTVQYFTTEPCESRVQVRPGPLPARYFGASKRPPEYREVVVEGLRRYHSVRVDGLQPATGYFYRVFDPGASPTSSEERFGAAKPWRREFAVATQSEPGRKTVIQVPVKVLLMPNVIDVSTAYVEGKPVALPEPMSQAEMERIREEFAVAARFFWVNSGMRYWVDWHIQVDDRWQRWGQTPEGVADTFSSWPVNRSYDGVDYRDPGGGGFTIVDTRNPLNPTTGPVSEELPYGHQVEVAFPRRYDRNTGKWTYRNSGGGTFGVDSFPLGFPGRSQFLGGGDTAWLATHEFHHQMESAGAFSLSNREDERIVFNHYAPRRRAARPDGSVDEQAWSTSGPHGEHWDGMAYWDRTLSDAQWLRYGFGQALSVVDADEDGFPDDDPRLPLDERRFGSDPAKAATDGTMGDLQKVMLSTWTPAPLQTSALKRRTPWRIMPSPTLPDSDGDGLVDGVDPIPLWPYAPFVWPMQSVVDGFDSEWEGVPPAGELPGERLTASFRHAFDDAGYSACLRLSGEWARVNLSLDGEGLGVYSGEGVQSFEIVRRGDAVDVTDRPFGAPGMTSAAMLQPDGSWVVEFRVPNRGKGRWFWTGSGRTIFWALNLWDAGGSGYAMHEPYRMTPARFLEQTGQAPMPANPPAAPDGPALAPGDPAVQVGEGWSVVDGAWACDHGGESALVMPVTSRTEFDLWIEAEAVSDLILGGFRSGVVPGAGEDYVAFVGGYGNTVSRMRVFGQELGESGRVVQPGRRHTMQFTRRAGELWVLLDGEPVLYAVDPQPDTPLTQLAVLGGYGGRQRIHSIRYR